MMDKFYAKKERHLELEQLEKLCFDGINEKEKLLNDVG